jgi:glycosyltransferase involved in cell wall biosynthesis
MKKVLVITYYWPPSGGAGVQRWVKFVKYLPQFGWEPVVYTPENPEMPAIDHSLEHDIPEGIQIIKTKIREPYAAYKKFVGRSKDDPIKAGFLSEKKNPTLTEKISVWIRGNLFIPDARKFWIKPSVRSLTRYLQENQVEVIVSTGPPHSMHLIGREISQKLNIPWIADFRDPWTNIDFYKDLMLTQSSDRKHRQMEKEVLEKADRVIVVGKGMANDFKKTVNRDYHIITNGFDEADFDTGSVQPDTKFTFAHIGAMVPARNPVTFWKAIHELVLKDPDLANDLEIKLVGQVDYSVRELIDRLELQKYVRFIPYLPHNKAMKLQREVGVLLLVINNTPNAKMVVTGKIFEYIHSGRPILCIGPSDGDAAAVLSETETGIVYDYDDLAGIKNVIRSFYVKYKTGDLNVKGKNISKYSRQNLTNQLAEVLNSLIRH